MKKSNIPEYILCQNRDLAKAVLRKIERESDLRWTINRKMPTDNISVFEADYYPQLVINTSQPDGMHFAPMKYYENLERVINFTKAEEYLGTVNELGYCELHAPDGRLKVDVDNCSYCKKIIENNNSMTNKTWDNLAENDVLVKGNDECKVLGICGQAVFTSLDSNFNKADSSVFTKEELIEIGYKIKGASEEKPSLENVIKTLEDALPRFPVTVNAYTTVIEQAIEILKKLK